MRESSTVKLKDIPKPSHASARLLSSILNMNRHTVVWVFLSTKLKKFRKPSKTIKRPLNLSQIILGLTTIGGEPFNGVINGKKLLKNIVKLLNAIQILLKRTIA